MLIGLLHRIQDIGDLGGKSPLSQDGSPPTRDSVSIRSEFTEFRATRRSGNSSNSQSFGGMQTALPNGLASIIVGAKGLP
jgi:hypothetical protein